MKYIFVTGGVVSGLGKGITAASLGRLLKSRGLKVASQKLDPYLNVDPGTMNPHQHGEVYVTEDGAETDLDLGHYERFIDEGLNKYSNLTSGKVYWNVLSKERAGDYDGETVQVIPHVTNEIKSYIYNVGKESGADVVITEVGGTIGDIEGQPFIEAIRQVGLEVGKENAIYIHVTLLPFLSGSDEYKTKPTQHSVKELQGMGIKPDIIVLRYDKEPTEEQDEKRTEEIKKKLFKKVAMFCNVAEDCVIENLTLPVLYEVPIMLEKQHLSDIVCRLLKIDAPACDLADWNRMLTNIENRNRTVTIGLVGKYMELHDAYLSVVEALHHAGGELGANIEIKWINSEDINDSTIGKIFEEIDGVVVPGGFGDRGIEGMILTANYCRKNNVPYLGICLGMQIAVISFARYVAGLKNAISREADKHAECAVIDFLPGQSDDVEKGGTLRLGAYPCKIKPDTQMYKCYGVEKISERHRHRYEFNNEYRQQLTDAGLVISGTSPDDFIVETVEIAENDFYVGVQFHPEFKSRPNKPHPLFVGLVKASMK